jgi:hypothetical protein
MLHIESPNVSITPALLSLTYLVSAPRNCGVHTLAHFDFVKEGRVHPDDEKFLRAEAAIGVGGLILLDWL